MPIRYPAEFVTLNNFQIAWERITRASNAQYKRFFKHLYPSYRFASTTILADLISEIRRGTYRPSPITTIYIPKASRILRPITLLSLNDQIVYQAIMNVIANRFYRVLRPHYCKREFGALYAGRNSLFFYRPWKSGYRLFNQAIKEAFLQGNKVLADFDLVSFFDLIDHKVLRKVLDQRVKSGELLDLLAVCLSSWSSDSPNKHQKGHGIPQGPEPSAFLAEVFLHSLDKEDYGWGCPLG